MRIVDLLRAGQAPAVIRRKGAEGSLPVSAAEKLEILVLLSQDAEEAIRHKAASSLQACDPAELQQVLAHPEIPFVVLDFAARHWAAEHPELSAVLLAHPALPAELREILTSRPAEFPGGNEAASPHAADASGGQRETLLQKISRMSVAEKIKTALLGNQEERALLIRDANKVVSRAVLESPKLSDREIESISMMKNVSEEVLRLVATNRKSVRSYAVVRNLTNNPRVPVDVALPLVHRLNDRDLKELSRNKNVAEVLRSLALKLLKQKEAAKRA